MVTYLRDISMNHVIYDIVIHIIIIFILVLPYFVYYAPNNEYCFYIAFYMAIFLTMIQIIAILYSVSP